MYFRVIPYFAQKSIDLPPLEDLLDVSLDRLKELENSTFEDTDEFFGTHDEPLADIGHAVDQDGDTEDELD